MYTMICASGCHNEHEFETHVRETIYNFIGVIDDNIYSLTYTPRRPLVFEY